MVNDQKVNVALNKGIGIFIPCRDQITSVSIMDFPSEEF